MRNSKLINMSHYSSTTTNISKNDENLLKGFVREFYHKILEIKDFHNTFELLYAIG